MQKKVWIYEFSHQKAHFWISLQFLFYIWNSQITWYSRDKIGTKFHNTAWEILILYFSNTDTESHWITDLLNWCMARLPTLFYAIAALSNLSSSIWIWWPTWQLQTVYWPIGGHHNGLQGAGYLHANITSLLDIECLSLVWTPHGRGGGDKECRHQQVWYWPIYPVIFLFQHWTGFNIKVLGWLLPIRLLKTN